MARPHAFSRVAAMGCIIVAAVCSSAAALLYGTLWARSFAIILGSRVEATSIFFAAFLAGLALGAWLFGRWRSTSRMPMKLYGIVQVAIAIVACGVGLLLHSHAPSMAGALGTSVEGHGPLQMVAGFVTTFVLVGLPTALMGGTLPLVLLAGRRAGAGISGISQLYGVKCFGAAAGTLACGYLTIPLLGLQGSYAVAAGLNLVAAAVCILMYALERRDPAMGASASAGAAPVAASSGPAEKEGDKAADAWTHRREKALLFMGMASGAAVLGLGVVWFRMGSFFLGNRTIAFFTILACVLLLLAMASWIAGRLQPSIQRAPLRTLGWLMLLGALGACLSINMGWWWIRWQFRVELAMGGPDLLGEWLLWIRFLETLILLAPTLLPLGTLFPLALMASHKADSATGQAAGQFSLYNIVGAVLGFLWVGFFGVSTLGTFGSANLLVSLLVVVALALLYLARKHRPSVGVHVGMAVAVLSLLLLPFPAQLSLRQADEEIIYRKEDGYGVFQVLRQPDKSLKAVVNKAELGMLLGRLPTSYVQQMQGHLGVFYNPDAKTAAVLGSGYGITAGALASHDSLERIDAVEIVPGMLEAGELFAPYNLSYWQDTRMRLHQDDGRHFLERSEAAYDIITITVSDPHLPGGASLFHMEFYDTVTARLAPGGIVLQHAFGVELETVLASLKASFPHLRLYRAHGNGFHVVASHAPLELDPEAITKLVTAPRAAQVLTAIGMGPPMDITQHLATGFRPEDLPQLFPPDAPIASDTFPRIGFAWSEGSAMRFFTNE